MISVLCSSGAERDISITEVASPSRNVPFWTSSVASVSLHRDVACGTDEVGLFDPQLAQFGRVVLVAEEVEDQLEMVRAFRQQLAGDQRVVDLLDHQLGKIGWMWLVVTSSYSWCIARIDSSSSLKPSS